ncbi:MAG: AtpZ/AtpI family protein [Anaerolineae bacterium]|nr:AtpZ/AtpI family protein [Anaerolineae bacterium]
MGSRTGQGTARTMKSQRSWFHTFSGDALAATSLGWDLALPIFGGVLGGHFLDLRWGTKPALTVGLLLLGILAGFLNIWRFVRRLEERQRLEEK